MVVLITVGGVGCVLRVRAGASWRSPWFTASHPMGLAKALSTGRNRAGRPLRPGEVEAHSALELTAA